MRTDIAEAYLEMQSAPSPVIYSGNQTPSSQGGTYSLEKTDSTPETQHATDDDFELSASTATSTTQPASQQATAPAEQTAAVEETSNSKAPAAADTPPNESKVEPEADNKTDDAAEKPDQPNSKTAANSNSKENHSDATAGDVLFMAALAEEKESGQRKRKKQPKAKTGFLIYCPNGHRVEVQERHRGMSGKCPKCKGTFHVPIAPPEPTEEEKQAAAEAEAKAAAIKAMKPVVWMTDVRLHTIDPKKIVLKANCLEKSFTPVDICFAQDGIHVVDLAQSGGLFGGGGDKKRIEVRETMLAAIQDGAKIADCDFNSHFLISETAEMQVVQPAANSKESLFAGVRIFGEWCIAVSIPREEEEAHPTYFSFYLKDFMQFSRLMNEFYQIEAFGEGRGFPLENKFTEYKCHYLDQKFQALHDSDYYEHDPKSELEISGRKCACCGMTISEDGRKKEKIGGKTGSGIAKAKCPKCNGKFGKQTFYALLNADEEPAAETGEEQKSDSAAEHVSGKNPTEKK